MRYHRPTRAARPPGRYVFVYDGDCGFCTRMASAPSPPAPRREVRLVSFTEVPAGEILGALSSPADCAPAPTASPRAAASITAGRV